MRHSPATRKAGTVPMPSLSRFGVVSRWSGRHQRGPTAFRYKIAKGCYTAIGY